MPASAKPGCPTCQGKKTAVKRTPEGGWYCHRCKSYVAQEDGEQSEISPIGEEHVEVNHRLLLASREVLGWLTDHRKISLDVIRKYRLGLESGRVVIPITNAEGTVVQEARAAPGEKLHVLAKRGVWLWPWVSAADRVLICEGPWDMLAAESLGYVACTGTGGADVWYPAWSKHLAETAARCAIVYDTDLAGRNGARRVREGLLGAGIESSRIHIVRLPLTEGDGKDLTDWVRAGGTRAKLEALLEPKPEKPADQAREVVDCTLAEAGSPERAWKWSRFDAAVQSLGVDLYQLPASVRVACNEDWQQARCAQCPIPGERRAQRQDEPVIPLAVWHQDFLGLCGRPVDEVHARVLKMLRIPGPCPKVIWEHETTTYAQEGRITDLMRHDSEGQPAEVPVTFFGLKGRVEPNQEYRVTGVSYPHPQDQVHVVCVHEVQGLADALASFQEDPKLLASYRPPMNGHKPRKAAPAGIGERVDRILSDAERVTRIWDRRDVHFLTLLTYASTTWLVDQGEQHRGWVDAAIVGDTRQGKSLAARRLMSWIGLGKAQDLKKRVSVAGLFGGYVRDRRNRNQLVWGLVPQMDRKLLILDEIQETPFEVIASLTGVRSSGEAHTTMSGPPAQTKARTRILWIGNGRKGRRVADYLHGVMMFPDLFGAPQDVARLDVGLVVPTSEVTTEMKLRAPDHPPEYFTAAVARHVITRAWAQRRVEIPAQVRRAAIEAADALAKKYAEQPPLIVSTDAHWKVLRLSVALANLLAEEVTPAHVAYIQRWLERIYDAPACGLDRLSEVVRAWSSIPDPAAVWRALDAASGGRGELVASHLLAQPEWLAGDFGDLTSNGDRYAADQLRSMLLRTRAVAREGRHYRVTEAAVALFRKGRAKPEETENLGVPEESPSPAAQSGSKKGRGGRKCKESRR